MVFGGYQFKREVPADLISGESSLLAYEQLRSYACGGQGEKEGGEGGREKKSFLMSLLKRTRILWDHSPSLMISFKLNYLHESPVFKCGHSGPWGPTYGFGEHSSGHSTPGPSPGSSLLLGTRDKRQPGPPSHGSLPQLSSPLSSSYHSVAAHISVWLWKCSKGIPLETGNAEQAGEFCSFFLLLQAQLGKVENGWSIHATLSTLLAGRDCCLSWGKASVDHTLVFLIQFHQLYS